MGPDPPVKLALIVRLSYLGTGDALPSTEFDQYRMYAILRDTYGFRNITVMHDDRKPGNPLYLTVANVRTQIKRIVAEARRLHNRGKRCALFFYYTGHGDTGYASGESANNKECLYLRGEFLEDEWVTELWDEELNQILANQIPYLTEAFVMVDACHSGTLLDLRHRYDSDPRVWERITRSRAEWRGRTGFAKEHTPDDKTRTSPGRLYYLSGCRDGETSQGIRYTDMSGKVLSISGGALTLAFEQLIKDRSKGRNFQIEAMVDWIIANVKGEKGCKNQTPLLSRNFDSNKSIGFADAIDGRDHFSQGGDNRNPHGVRIKTNPNDHGMDNQSNLTVVTDHATSGADA